jgi:DNA-binding response OmpR family regulator
MRGTTILVAEDDPSTREMLAEMLEMEGYAVEVAEDAETVIGALSERRFAAVMLDLSMPGRTREELVVGLCGLPSPSPFIVFSARPGPEIQEIAARLHAAAVIPKPTALGEMMATIHRVTRQAA